MLVTKFMSRHVPVIPEDNNVVDYPSVGMMEVDLKRRARCVMGMRDQTNADTILLNGNAIQHATRMIAGGYVGKFQVMEHIVAEYAVHIANETQYWN